VRRTIVITAGPTREKIDPVRFISNYSTGSFGYELAREAVRRGLKTVLISGPTAIDAPRGVKLIEAESALDMKRAVLKELKNAGYLIMAAAVSDWRAAAPAARKMKKGAGQRVLRLVENPDILAAAGKLKKRAVVAGFALETNDTEQNALGKLKKKRLDMIIANTLSSKTNPFGDNITDIILLDRRGGRYIYRRKSKRKLSKIILDKVLRFTI